MKTRWARGYQKTIARVRPARRGVGRGTAIHRTDRSDHHTRISDPDPRSLSLQTSMADAAFANVVYDPPTGRTTRLDTELFQCSPTPVHRSTFHTDLSTILSLRDFGNSHDSGGGRRRACTRSAGGADVLRNGRAGPKGARSGAVSRFSEKT